MFDKLFSKKSVAKDQPEAAPAPHELGVAALLVEAARADERYEPREISLIDRALSAHFDLSEAQSVALRKQAEERQAKALDIQQFTKQVKSLAHDDKLRLIENLWRIILIDEEKDPFEDALMRRICGLIYVSDLESGQARQRIEAELKG